MGVFVLYNLLMTSLDVVVNCAVKILTVRSGKNFESTSILPLAQLADHIVEVSSGPVISATDAHMHSQLTTQVMELTKCLDQLTSQMSCAINNTHPVTYRFLQTIIPAAAF